MHKKNIITIAGKPGSGKSSTSKAVATLLGYRHFSSGDLFRAVARDRGMDVRTANEQAEKESSIDDMVDRRLQEIGRADDNLVIDSRTAWHWMPTSFKVYLDLDFPTAADRILSKLDRNDEHNEYVPESKEEYIEELERRHQSEVRRYDALYGIDPYDTRNYDLVIDTKKYKIDSVIQQVVDTYNTWKTQS